MPRTIVPEEQQRVQDVNKLAQNVFPTDNRVVNVISDPDDQFTPYYWDPNGDPVNADGIEIIESKVTGFGQGEADAGTWKRGRRNVGVLDNLLPEGVSLEDIDGTNGQTAKIGLPDGDTSKNEVFSTSGNRNGVIGPQGETISGTLNPQVQSTDNYQNDTFDRATEGTLKLVVNGSNLVTLDLTVSGSNTQTSANGSQLSVTAENPITFINGEPFDGNDQRTGTYQVVQADLTQGTNTIKVRHEDGGSNLIGESETLEYFLDPETSNITFASESVSNLQKNTTKQLSGVAYNTGGTVDYSVSASNVYKNTFENGTGITFSTTNVSLSNISIEELGTNEDETKTLQIAETASIDEQRIIGGSLSVQATIDDPIDSNAPFTTSGVTDFDVLIDQVNSGNSALSHNFNDENYRVAPDANLESDLGSGAYDSAISIADGSANGYGSELQVTEGKIVYPSIDYSTIANGPTGNPNYSGTNTTGERTYFGIFTDTLAVSNFVLNINGTGTLVSEGQATTGDELSVSIKAPTQTGFMDINENFEPGQTADGNGAYQETNATNPSQSVGPNSEIGLTIGEKSTVDAFDSLIYRITVPEDFTGEITQMTIDWGANN